MKNLLYVFGIAGSVLLSEKVYSQDTLKRGNLNIEKFSGDVNTQSEYGKTITSDFLMNYPYKVNTEKLTRDELELFYLDIATEYKKTLEKYGNLQKDCEANKIKVILITGSEGMIGNRMKEILLERTKIQ